jgi:GxxExxY protein
MNSNPDKEKIDDPLTYKIIGCAQQEHATLGNGFQEVIYQKALAIEFRNNGIGFERELEMPIVYNEEHIRSRRFDFLVENAVLVELKAVIVIEDAHLAQGLNYLVAYKLDKGLLINFGARSLEVKRLRHPKNKMPSHYTEIHSSINPTNPNAYSPPSPRRTFSIL